jgi:hypothetical protein
VATPWSLTSLVGTPATRYRHSWMPKGSGPQPCSALIAAPAVQRHRASFLGWSRPNRIPRPVQAPLGVLVSAQKGCRHQPRKKGYERCRRSWRMTLPGRLGAHRTLLRLNGNAICPSSDQYEIPHVGSAAARPVWLQVLVVVSLQCAYCTPNVAGVPPICPEVSPSLSSTAQQVPLSE